MTNSRRSIMSHYVVVIKVCECTFGSYCTFEIVIYLSIHPTAITGYIILRSSSRLLIYMICFGEKIPKNTICNSSCKIPFYYVHHNLILQEDFISPTAVLYCCINAQKNDFP